VTHDPCIEILRLLVIALDISLGYCGRESSNPISI